MPTATLGDIDLYYETSEGASEAVASDRPRLLFIGGTGGDLRQQPSVFTGPLAREFALLAYDQRGLGRSGKPDRDYTMAEYADDAAALIAYVGWENASVVGVSFGGMVAQELAIRHPHRVDRLVLACTSSGGKGGASYPLHELADLPPEQAAPIRIEIADRRYDAAWRRDNPDAFARLVELAGDRDPIDPSDDALRGARRQLEARSQHDTWERLPRITAPTLLCGGRTDGIAPPDNMEALASRIPGAKLEFFEGGHLFLIQDRAAFPRIMAFLKGE